MIGWVEVSLWESGGSEGFDNYSQILLRSLMLLPAYWPMGDDKADHF